MTTVSVKDVARRAGVSVGTVSNVLNGRASVGSAAADRVRAAIAELGYVRNDAARQLRLGRSRTVGLILMDVGNPFFTELARGAESEADDRGLAVVIGNSGEDPGREASYLDLFEEQRVRGILLSPIGELGSRLGELRARGTSTVLVDRSSDDATFSSVSVDDVAGGRLAAAHLLQRGRRRLAFIGGPVGLRQVDDRLTGAAEAVRGVPGAELAHLVTAGLTMADGASAGEGLMGRHPASRPDGVFAANDLVALGVLQALSRHGTRVPADIALVGFDDIPFGAGAAVPLSSVRQPARLMGATALRLLVEEADGSAADSRHVVFEPELVVRASSR